MENETLEFEKRQEDERRFKALEWLSTVAFTIGLPLNVVKVDAKLIYDDGAELNVTVGRKP